MAKRYRVTLTAEERDELDRMISPGKADARKLAHARVLLLADASEAGPGWSDATISEAVRSSVGTIERVRQRFVEDGLSAALLRTPRPRLCAQTGWSAGGAADCSGLLGSACGQEALDAAIAGRADGGAGDRRRPEPRDGAPGAGGKMRSGRTCGRCGAFRQSNPRSSSVTWRTCSRSTPVLSIRDARWCAWTS